MDARARAQAALVRQYELLLTARHRFLLAEAVSSLHAVARALQRAAQQLRRAQLDTRSARAAPAERTFRRAVERARSQLQQLTASQPVFLGDTELLACVGALREWTRDARAEFTAVEAVNVRERQLVTALSDSVVGALERELVALEHAVATALPVARALRKKRDHLAALVDASLTVVEGTSAARTAYYEEKKAQLLARFEEAVQDPSLREMKQAEFEVQLVEKAIQVLLAPHTDISRPITAANARVVEDGTFDRNDCEEISRAVHIVFKLNDSSADLGSVLEDTGVFLRRVQLFEKAASKDAFVVFSSALKLNFNDSLDEELFLAYVADWRGKRQNREELLASKGYQEASQRIATLKEDIVRMQANIQASRKQVVLDASSKATLLTQITSVFHEAGGDTAQVIQIIE